MFYFSYITQTAVPVNDKEQQRTLQIIMTSIKRYREKKRLFKRLKMSQVFPVKSSLQGHSLFVFPSRCKVGNACVNSSSLLSQQPSTDHQGRRGWGGRQDPALTGAPGWAVHTEGPPQGWASHHTSHSWGSPCSYTGESCFSASAKRQTWVAYHSRATLLIFINR